MEISVELDEYTFHCEVIHYHYQKPMSKWADSDWDCYGCEEMEFVCHVVTITDEDGSTTDIDNNTIICELLHKEYYRGTTYYEYIEEHILSEIHERQSDIDYD